MTGPSLQPLSLPAGGWAARTLAVSCGACRVAWQTPAQKASLEADCTVPSSKVHNPPTVSDDGIGDQNLKPFMVARTLAVLGTEQSSSAYSSRLQHNAAWSLLTHPSTQFVDSWVQQIANVQKSSMQQRHLGYHNKHSKQCPHQQHQCRQLRYSRPCRRPGCPTTVRATGQSPNDDTGSTSPFRRKNGTAEESARKALKDMFSGQKDILAALDPDTSGGGGKGGSGGKGKGHGGGGSWDPPNWQEWGESFSRQAGSGLKALLAICAFLAAFAAIPMVPQLLALFLGLVQSMLRLGGRAASLPQRAPVNAAALAGTEDLGKFEVSVLMKYGGANRQYISGKQEGD